MSNARLPKDSAESQTMKDHFRGHVHVGIAGFGTYVPNNRVSAEQIAQEAGIPIERLTQGIGFRHIHRASTDEHPLSMGVAAARAAIADAGLTATDIDLIIFVSAGDYDYRFWSPASAAVQELGCRHTYAFELRNGCAGGNLACTTVAGLMDRDSSLQNALVICADTLSRLVSPSVNDCGPLLYFGDGAAAVVLRRNHPRYQLMGFSEHTDGELSALLRIEPGGTREPFSPGFNDWKRTYARVDAKKFSELINRVYLDAYTQVIERACKLSGHAIHDIDYLLMNQIKASLRDDLMNRLGLPLTKTFNSLSEMGHIGPADAFFTMAEAHRQRLIKAGDLAVIATSGLGFSWAATSIRC